ncbi:hypothetical protein D0846_01870 [Bordetella avium]|jgi:hypothetical protein|nr:hypothetical protein AL520_09010 [Achromobacter xylosoxidans]RIQ14756.1 hypothetical protein D0432_01075 [Bordetella avium]CAB3839189.1 hypothetical protein LMG26686_01361 [Achromobacter mucicolens]RIQ41219.1 hypothetical protein D0848_01715 [Bordetella avium]RIQ45993.1 hypothetical protein D0847_01865 [Bordetella avium]
MQGHARYLSTRLSHYKGSYQNLATRIGSSFSFVGLAAIPRSDRLLQRLGLAKLLGELIDFGLCPQ